MTCHHIHFVQLKRSGSRHIAIERSGLDIDGGLSATLHGELDARWRAGTLTLRDVALRDADGQASFAADVVTLGLKRDDQGLNVHSPELGLSPALSRPDRGSSDTRTAARNDRPVRLRDSAGPASPPGPARLNGAVVNGAVATLHRPLSADVPTAL